MQKLPFIIGIWTLLLSTAVIAAENDFNSQFRENVNFYIQIPNELIYKVRTGIRQDGPFLFATSKNLSLNSLDSDYYLHIYKKNEFKTCPNLGISKPNISQLIDGTDILQGKIDYFDIYTSTVSVPDYPLDFDSSFCVPFKENGSAYAFCGKKQEDTAVICLSQQTDNPQQAKQIFESFRWLDPTDVFTDVPLSHPQATAIKYIKEKNIVQGYEDSTFKPNNTINRAEFTKILTLAAALPSKKCDVPAFTDIDTKAWYMPSLTLAYCHTLVQGYSTNEFKPSTNINAAEMYKIVAKAFAVPIAEDANSVWYMPYENALKNIDAIPKSITSADQFITRGEMAEVIYSLLQYRK